MSRSVFSRFRVALPVALGIVSCAMASGKCHHRDIDSVKILAINDFHGQITEGQKVSNRPVGGAAVLASYLKSAAKGWDGRVFLVDAGDMIGASQPQSALLQDEPAIMFLNAMKGSKKRGRFLCPGKEMTVIGTIGNHELDEGIPELRRLLIGGNYVNGPFLENPWRGADFPVINANITDSARNIPKFLPFYISEVPKINTPIAFIGAVLSETPTMISANAAAGLKFSDEAKSINRQVKFLEKFGIHAFVILLHQGGAQTSYTGWTDTLKALPSSDICNLVAKLDDDVDVVCSAHSHGFTNAMVKNRNGVPILVTQAYSKGTAYADIELVIDRTERDIVAKKARIVTTYADIAPGTTPDPEIQEMVSRASTMVEPLTSRIITTTTALITKTQNAAGESPLGNLIADAQRSIMNTDFAFMNPGGIRADMPAGNVTWGDLYTVQPFGNYMVTMTMTGRQIYDVLEEQWLNQPYVKMLQVSGLTYTWDSTRAAGSRIVEVRKGGYAIDRNMTYTVTANNFLAGGGDNFTTFRDAPDKVNGPADLDVFIQYLQTLSTPISVDMDGRITVIPSFFQFVFTSDAHYGITRPVFRGAGNVDAHSVNAAMTAEMNTITTLTLPDDNGVRAGRVVGGIDYVIETGDIANRMEVSSSVQSAEVSWMQFTVDYIDGITLKNNEGMNTGLLLAPGNHDATNAVGFYKTMFPATDASSMAAIYNFTFNPISPKTKDTYSYTTDKVNYSRDFGGIHFMFVNIWPDSANRIWMENDLAGISSETPVLLFTHDEPEVESKHFTNPNGDHSINATDKFENLLDEMFKDGTTTDDPSTIEQRGFVAFLKNHPNIKGYFNGNAHFNTFYDYTGPDNDVALATFQADSPMKGKFSKPDETMLSFQLVTINLNSQMLTARECLWNTNPADPSTPVAFGEMRTISLR